MPVDLDWSLQALACHCDTARSLFFFRLGLSGTSSSPLQAVIVCIVASSNMIENTFFISFDI